MNEDQDMNAKEIISSKFKLPWSIESYPDDSWAIHSDDGKEVMYCASFTGDGATISLEYEQACAMIELINLSIRIGQIEQLQA